MPEKLEFIVTPEFDRWRLDRALSALNPSSSRAFLQKLIAAGAVSCDGSTVTQARFAVRSGMRLVVERPEAPPVSDTPSPEPFNLPILFEDEYILVINKPSGVVVHPAAGNPDGTVANALLGRYPQLAQFPPGSGMRPGIVHRLDKDTTGCLIAAKTPEAQYRLGEIFAAHEVDKCYLALVRGRPRRLSGELSTLIGRHPANRQKMAVVERNGKNAVTCYETLFSGELEQIPISLLRVKILTGRTHQIRVHLASIGHPVLGDPLYGGAAAKFAPAARQLLHAWKLALPHPVTGRKMHFTAPVPEDMLAVMDALGINC